MLADLATPASVPAESDLELEEPVEAEWAVGSMQLAYDPVTDRVHDHSKRDRLARRRARTGRALTEDEADEPAGATARVALTARAGGRGNSARQGAVARRPASLPAVWLPPRRGPFVPQDKRAPLSGAVSGQRPRRTARRWRAALLPGYPSRPPSLRRPATSLGTLQRRDRAERTHPLELERNLLGFGLRRSPN